MNRFFGKKSRELPALLPEVATDRNATPQQSRLLIIGEWFSTCGDCRQNASWREKTHEYTYSILKGCGVEWEHVTSDEAPRDAVVNMRPDLKWLDRTQDILGASFATEAVALSGYRTLGTFNPDEVIDGVINIPPSPDTPEN